jgi:HTH-type transcriptional regulator, sugar sensing transcriptional regulator
MADDSEFITRLIGFGLSEKEAQVYLHLLKYGPKPTSLLAKSLKTYREDVHRTLNGLIGKGMVNPSLQTPTVYAAVELDIALGMALKKHESELREMERRKQELQELSKQPQFRLSDEVSSFKILKSVREVVEAMLEGYSIMSEVTSPEKEWLLCVVSPITFLLASLYGITESAKKHIEHGGGVGVITDVSYPYIELIQQHLDIGVDIHHYDQYAGIMYIVFDRRSSMSAINADISRVSLNEPLSALWTNDATYSDYLISTFKVLWEQSVPAAQRIEELLKEGPPPV